MLLILKPYFLKMAAYISLFHNIFEKYIAKKN